MVDRSSLPSAFAFIHTLPPVVLAVVFFFLSLIAFSWRLGDGPIYRTMEGREALVMQEIARSGNYILPLRNGETIPSKPPLLHWIGMGVAFLSGGVSEWSARFHNALFSALSIALTCLLGCRLSGREVGVIAALLLLTTPCFLEMSREAWVDPALAFFTLAAVASFEPRAPLAEATDAFVRARYGPADPTDGDVAQAERGVAAVLEHLGRRPPRQRRDVVRDADGPPREP